MFQDCFKLISLGFCYKHVVVTGPSAMAVGCIIGLVSHSFVGFGLVGKEREKKISASILFTLVNPTTTYDRQFVSTA